MSSGLLPSTAPCHADYDCSSCKCDMLSDAGFFDAGGAGKCN
jgi:hypothetical protein